MEQGYTESELVDVIWSVKLFGQQNNTPKTTNQNNKTLNFFFLNNTMIPKQQ